MTPRSGTNSGNEVPRALNCLPKPAHLLLQLQLLSVSVKKAKSEDQWDNNN